MSLSVEYRQLPLRKSLQDWLSALRMWRLWTSLGLEDLSDRYRRTALGLSWLITSFALFIFIHILVFAQSSGVSRNEYAIYIAVGFGLWTFIGSMVSDTCIAYTASSGWILGSSIPYPTFFLQAVFRNWLAFLAKLLVMAAVLVWLKDDWEPTMLWAIPGLIAYMLAPLWLAAMLAPLCARFRDVMHAVQTAMQMLFFVTPILWLPGHRSYLASMAKYNIFTYFIDIVRTPLVYNTVPYHSWLVVIVANAIGILLGFIIYVATRNRIVYWL